MWSPRVVTAIASLLAAFGSLPFNFAAEGTPVLDLLPKAGITGFTGKDEET